MATNRCCLGLFAFAVSVLFPRLALSDQCIDILDQGIRNQYHMSASRNVRTALTDALCKSKETENSGAGGGGASVLLPINGIPVKFGGDYQQQHTEQLKQAYCHNRTSDLSNNDYVWFSEQVADGAIISAWAGCMRDRAQFTEGVHSNLSSNGSNLIFSANWVDIFDVPPPTIEGFYAEGAKCHPIVKQLRPGKRLTKTGFAQPCKRSGEDPVTIVLETSLGPAVEDLKPAPPTAPKVHIISDTSIVPSTQQWIDTGIALSPGDTVHLEADDKNTGWTIHYGGYPIVHSCGWDWPSLFARDNRFTDLGHRGGFAKPDANPAALLARVGDGSVVSVCGTADLTATVPGHLFLGINDTVSDPPALTDNWGSIAVKITGAAKAQ